MEEVLKKILIVSEVFYPEEFKINEYEVFGIARTKGTKYIKKELSGFTKFFMRYTLPNYLYKH